jgi:hypothetical protein
LITAAYLGNSTAAVANYTVPREAILQGFAGVEQLNGTINGKGDHEFLQNFIVIINGQSVKLLLGSRTLLLMIIQLSISNSIQRMVLEQYKVRDTSIASPESEFRSLTSPNRWLSRTNSYASTNQPRLLRLISPINTAVHNLILIDSPKFHFVLDFGLNVEVYHLTI